jgi:hypothetical protein
MRSSPDLDVFICHRSDDAGALAAKLHAYLNANGARAFCDQIDDPHDTLGERIYDRIRTAATFLVILTEGVIRSLAQHHSSIRRELSCAQESGRRIAVVQVGRRSVLPPNLAPALEKCIPRVHILVSPPSAATLRLITNSVVSTPIDLKAEVDGFDAPWVEVAAIMAGVRATAMGEFDHARLAESALRARLGGSSEHLMDRRITGRDLVDACEDVTSAAARALMTRTLAVGLLKHVARPVPPGRAITDLRPLWPLLRSTIDGPTAVPARFVRSPQGFYAMPLMATLERGRIKEMLRLHVWPWHQRDGEGDARGQVAPPARPQRSNLFSVHSHQAHATSWVLAGQVENKAFSVVQTPHSPPEAESLNLFQLSSDDRSSYSVNRQQSPVRNTRRPAAATPECAAILSAGQSYTVGAGEFHETTIDSETPAPPVSLFLFDATQGWAEDAAVIGPATLNADLHPPVARATPQEIIDRLDAVL